MAAVGSLFEEVTLLTVGGQPRAGAMPLPADTEVVTLQSPSGTGVQRKRSLLLRLPYYLRSIVEQVRKADAIHVPLPGDIPFLGMVVALAFRKPLFARYCASWHTNSQTTFMDRVTQTIMRRFAGGRNVMIATGLGDDPPARDMHWLFASNISENEIQAFRPDLNLLPKTSSRLAYVGRLAAVKGVEDIINALAILRRNETIVERMPHLTILGDGPQRNELMSLADRLGCADFVTFVGQVDRRELFEHLLHTDLCVLPSLSESFCKARLDAMLCGVPVITTEVGFGREIVGSDGERGWIVPVRDPWALAETLHQQITSTSVDWPALRARCRRYAETHTIEAWSQRIGNLCASSWSMAVREGRLKNV